MEIRSSRKNARRLALACATLALSASPALALAQSTTPPPSSVGGVQAQIQALMQQLASLEQQLAQMNASGTPQQQSQQMPIWISGSSTPPWMSSTTMPWMLGSTTPLSMSSTTPPLPHPTPMMQGTGGACPSISRNLSVGSQGSDVSQLQQFLAQYPNVYPQGNVTGFFGPMTAKAVARFQQQFGVASSSTGFVGPQTRAFFHNGCNSGTPGQQPMMPGSGAGAWMGSSTMPFMMGTSTQPMPPLGNQNQGYPVQGGAGMMMGTTSPQGMGGMNPPPPPLPTNGATMGQQPMPPMPQGQGAGH